jgi:hypothetical protein
LASLQPSSVPCRLEVDNLGLPKNIKFHAEPEEKRFFENVLKNVSAIHGVMVFSTGAPLGRVMLRLPGTILLVQLSRAAFMIEIIGKATASDL